MNEREFCYWLQGLFEVGGVKSLDETQVQIVKDHLALVFKKVTPDRSGNANEKLEDLFERYRKLVVEPAINPRTPLDAYPWQPYRGATCSGQSGLDNKVVAIC